MKVIKKIGLSLVQRSVIAICFFCNFLDGMDVLIISYTAPVIANQWSISPSSLGLVFSSGLIGMTLGAILLAPLADRFGRKPLMLTAAILMSISIYYTSMATSIDFLMIYRFFSGLGIGIMMATTASITAEYSPEKSKGFWISFVIAGYPVGAVLTGLVSATIISLGGWQSLYKYAGILSALSIPIIIFFLKESNLFKSQNKHQYQHPKLLFKNSIRKNTFLLWSSLFLCFATLYYLINWIPKLATNAGLPIELAIYAGTIFNTGAIIGILTQGYFSSLYGLTRTVGLMLLFSTLLLFVFGFFEGSVLILVDLFLLGFSVQGGFVGLYAIAASLYKTQIRTTGVGWSIGIGRIGGIIGPIVGGFLLSLGLTMTTSFIFFAFPIGFAGILTLLIQYKNINK